MKTDSEILVYRRSSRGDLFVFVIDPDRLSSASIFECSVKIIWRAEPDDGKSGYIVRRDLLKLHGKILKYVEKINGSVNTYYYSVYGLDLVKLESSREKDENGFFDKVVMRDGRVLGVKKDSVVFLGVFDSNKAQGLKYSC